MVKQFLKREWFNTGLIALTLVVGAVVITPGDVLADVVPHPTPAEQKAIKLMVSAMQNSYADYGVLPTAEDREAPFTMKVPTTAYSSDVWQTDATPFITASGTHVRHGVVAANFLPIGTKVKIPKLYGDQIFVVEDRMNKRYGKHLDIWMERREDAKRFGVKTLEIEIYK